MKIVIIINLYVLVPHWDGALRVRRKAPLHEATRGAS